MYVLPKNKEAEHMQIQYNVKGSQRKALIAAMRTVLNDIPHYEGAPTFNYTLGAYTIDKNGTVSCPHSHESAEVQNLISELEHDGFTGEVIPDFEDLQMTMEEELGLGRQHRDDEQGENGMQVSDMPEPDATRLSIGLPCGDLGEAGLENLKQIVASKAGLIKKALGTDELPIEVDGNKIYFDWFPAPSSEAELDAYSKLLTALLTMAKTQKRVTAMERNPENEKYAFRCFLLRLGFIGDEYKAARKLLLRNLSGNGAFKAAPAAEEAE